MHVSDEQMLAVRHGAAPPTAPSWELVDLPAGPMPMPEWMKDMHIDWVDGYQNPPRYTLKSWGDLRKWPNKRFTKLGPLYLAVSPDERAECYYQGGGLSKQPVRRFKSADGSLTIYRPPHAEGEWVEVPRLCTRQEEGFGGLHIDIVMDDGTEVTLRGPWRGSTPTGLTEVAYADASRPDFAAQSAWWRKTNRRNGNTTSHCWGTPVGGLYLTDELFIRLFARFKPHLRLARVNDGWRPHLEAMKPEWIAPKDWTVGRYATKAGAQP